MDRNVALDRIKNSEMSEHFLKQEFEYIANKLNVTTDELKKIFVAPRKTYRYYKNKRWLINLGANQARWLKLEQRFFR